MGTSVTMVASLLLWCAFSLAFNACCTLGGAISLIWAYISLMLPNCWSSFTAVFSPMPATPGMLSEGSPFKPFRSAIWGGEMP